MLNRSSRTVFFIAKPAVSLYDSKIDSDKTPYINLLLWSNVILDLCNIMLCVYILQ